MRMGDIYSTWDRTFQGSTTMIENVKEYLVSYRTENGKPYRVIFRVKPNPIGFIWRKT